MGVHVIGPDGRHYVMPDGTSEEDARRKIAGYAARERAGATVSTVAVADRVPVGPKRTALERMANVFSDTFETSAGISADRQGFTGSLKSVAPSPLSIMNQAADYTDRFSALLNAALGRRPEPAVPARPAPPSALTDAITAGLSISADPLSAVRASAYMRGGAAERAAPGARAAVRDAEIARQREFAAASAADPWYKADGGVGGKALHGASALVGVLSATAIDPTSYISGGRTLLARAATQSLVAAGADYVSQSSDQASGIRQDYDVTRTALSAGAGFVFSSGSELLMRGPKGWSTGLFSTPEAKIAPILDVADDLNAPALTRSDLPALRTPEQPDLFDAPPVTPTPPKDTLPVTRPAPQGGPEAGPKAADGGPKVDPQPADSFSTYDWGRVGSPERRAAAEAHLLTLRKAIKPEAVSAFLRQLERGLDPALPNGSPRVSHINPKYVDWDAINASPELTLAWVKAREDIFSDVYKAAGQTGRVSFDQIAATARLFDGNVSDITRAHANITGEGGISASIVAIKEAALESDSAFVTQMDELMIKVKDGTATDTDRLAFASSMERTVMFDAMAKSATAEVARSLAVMKRLARPRLLYNDVAADLADSLNKGRTLKDDELVDVINRMRASYGKGGSAHLRDTIRSMRAWGATEYIGYLVNGALLSAPKTFIRNFVGPAIHTAMLISDRYIAAGVGGLRAVAGQAGERVTFREASAYTAALAESLQEAIIIGGRAFKAGVPVTEGGSTIHPDQMPFVPFEMTAERAAKWKADGMTLGTAVDRAMVGMFSTTRALAYRPMVASDEFYKTIARRGEIAALAHREAAYRASKASPSKAAAVYAETLRAVQEEPTSAAITSAKAYFATEGGNMDDVFNPGTKAEEMALMLKAIDIKAAAVDHARLLTFQDAGPLASKMDQAIRAMPLIKYGFVNFVRTPLAIFRSAMVDRNPALAFLAKENRDGLGFLLKSATDSEAALGRGGAEADLVLGRLATGMAMMTFGWGLWASGNLTGRRGGYGSAEQSDGVQPYAMQLPGGTWVQLTSLSPLAEPLKLIANVAETMHEHDLDDDQSDALMSSLLVGLSDAALGATMVQGFNDLLTTLGVTGGAGTGDEARTTKADKALKKAVVPRLIPMSSMVKSVAQEFDPVRREVDTWADAFRAYVPLLSRTLPARRDFLGRTEVIPAGQRGAVQAFPTSHRTKDPLMLELSRLAVALQRDPTAPAILSLDKPPRRFNGREISFEEYGQLMEVQGQRVMHPQSGLNMEDHLRALVGMPEYQALAAPAQAAEIKKTISLFRSMGTEAVKDPSSPVYMGEMVVRTGRERLLREARANQWSPAVTSRKAKGMGVDLTTVDPKDKELTALRAALFP